MSYHKTKMAEINKIIREIWKNTYRGNGRLVLFVTSTVMSVILSYTGYTVVMCQFSGQIGCSHLSLVLSGRLLSILWFYIGFKYRQVCRRWSLNK